jgi:DNA-directed RNA polymerase subunit RPC12/RpoP
MCAFDRRSIVPGVDLRYVCGQCGKKWFVRGDRVSVEEALRCGACGRPLTFLDAHEQAPGWNMSEPVQRL